MVELGATRIFPRPSEASANRTKLPFPSGGGRLRGANPRGCIEPITMWTIDRCRKGRLSLSSPGSNRASSIVRSRGAVARIAFIKPAMRVDNR